MLKATDFFALQESPFKELFKGTEYVWEALPRLKAFIKEMIRPNVKDFRAGSAFIKETVVIHKANLFTSGFNIDTVGKKTVVRKDGIILEGASIIYGGSYLLDDQIFIGEGTIIEPGALIKGPTIIGDRTEVRHGAYIRGDALIGNDCVVGHATEIKSSVMMGGSKAGHFAYIGDSLLGEVNLGAGTKLANLKVIDSPVVLNIQGRAYETGLRKFGAILADGVETGCNCVTTPGTLMGKNALLYPNGTARGYYAPGTIVKIKQEQEFREMSERGSNG